METTNLIFENQHGNKEFIPLNEKLIIGNDKSNKENSFILDEPEISKDHCFILRKNNSYQLIDNGSQTGTMLNGMKISAGKTYLLSNGDQIGLSDFQFKVIKNEKEVKETPIQKISDDKINEDRVEDSIVPQIIFSDNENRKSDTEILEKDLNKTFENKKVLELKNTEDNRLAGAFSRICSFVTDLTITFFLYKFIVIDKSFSVLSLSTSWLFKDIYQFIGIQGLTILSIFLVTTLLSRLLIGVTIGQFLCGIRIDHQSWLKRILSFFQQCFSIVFFPLLLLDFIVVFEKRTLKERIFQVTLIEKRKWPKFLVIFFIVPLLMLSMVSGKWLKGVYTNDPISNELKKTTLPFVLAPENIDMYEKGKYFSPLKLGLYEGNGTNEIEILPSGQVDYIKGDKIVLHKLSLYDQKEKVSATFHLERVVSLSEFFEEALKENPFLKNKRPHLFEYITENKIGNKKLLQNELKYFLLHALEFSKKDIRDFVYKEGPFLNYGFLLKKNLLTTSRLNLTPSYSMFTRGENLILTFDFMNQKKLSRRYLVFGGKEGFVKEYWLELDDIKSLKKFNDQFISKIIWNQSLNYEYTTSDIAKSGGIVGNLYLENDFNLFPEEVKRSFFDNLFFHYKKLAAKSIEGQDQSFSMYLINLINQQINLHESVYSTRYKDFKIDLIKIKNALIKKDLKYFQLPESGSKE